MKKARPFWLPASNYYILAIAVSAGIFFILWGVLHDLGDETPWITAGVTASIILASAVITREFILLRTRPPKRTVSVHDHGATERSGKLTLEGNAAVLREIKQKSEAANVLTRFSAGHREVYELCSEYLARNDDELKTVSAASPRLAALLRGRTAAVELHKHHMLRWAEIEARNLTAEAKMGGDGSRRIAAAHTALSVIDSALASYPSERSLLESRDVVVEMVVLLKVAEIIAAAERSAFDGDYHDALRQYREGLFELGRGNPDNPERVAVVTHINGEIEKLRSLESG